MSTVHSKTRTGPVDEVFLLAQRGDLVETGDEATACGDHFQNPLMPAWTPSPVEPLLLLFVPVVGAGVWAGRLGDRQEKEARRTTERAEFSCRDYQPSGLRCKQIARSGKMDAVLVEEIVAPAFGLWKGGEMKAVLLPCPTRRVLVSALVLAVGLSLLPALESAGTAPPPTGGGRDLAPGGDAISALESVRESLQTWRNVSGSFRRISSGANPAEKEPIETELKSLLSRREVLRVDFESIATGIDPSAYEQASRRSSSSVRSSTNCSGRSSRN